MDNQCEEFLTSVCKRAEEQKAYPAIVLAIGEEHMSMFVHPAMDPIADKDMILEALEYALENFKNDQGEMTRVIVSDGAYE